jgi:purine-binding chemotaxis protein CheW
MAEPEENLELVRQYLMFNLGGETYGVGIHAIREIIEYPGVTAIPLAPRFMHGVINLRGAVVPVLDLSVRFDRTCIVVVEVAQGDTVHMLGVLVDGVTEVREVEPAEVERKPQFGIGLRNDFVIGMLRREQGFIPILDIASVLSMAELETLIEAGAGSADAATAAD